MPHRVYALYSSEWKGVKIGFTTRSVESRICEGQTWCPQQIKVACVITVSDGKAIEGKIHRALKAFRGNGEFFNCDLKKVRETMKYFGSLEGEHVPESILDHTYENGYLMFQVKWEDYKRTTWEPYQSLSHLTILNKYMKKMNVTV